MQKLYLLLLYTLLSFMLMQAGANEKRCLKLAPEIRKAHSFYFGLDFPYHYSVAQAEKESQCRHNVLSRDGIGSEGFAQITFYIWKSQLSKAGITEINSIPNHAKAQAFINKFYYDRIYCKKLFVMYQAYNGGLLINKELGKVCTWDYGYRNCKRKNVCVWKKDGKCMQYRNACEINYEYSVIIFKLAKKYKTTTDNDLKYPFF